MRGAALLVVAIGCSAPAATSPPANIQPPGAPTTPPPAVAFQAMRLEASRLPAIAVDGSAVVYAVIAPDGGRGNPNLTLVVKDRSDHELERFVVVTADETEGQYDDRGPSPALQAKLDAANVRLADFHAINDLQPLMLLANDPAIALTFSASRVKIRAHDKLVVDIPTPESWTIASRPMCTTCVETCRHSFYLDAAYADARHALVLLTVAYAGTDTCPEPVSEHLVITW